MDYYCDSLVVQKLSDNFCEKRFCVVMQVFHVLDNLPDVGRCDDTNNKLEVAFNICLSTYGVSLNQTVCQKEAC